MAEDLNAELDDFAKRLSASAQKSLDSVIDVEQRLSDFYKKLANHLADTGTAGQSDRSTSTN